MIRILIGISILGLFCNLSHAQAGIYSENDIQLQDIYIEAQLEKQKGNYDRQIDLLEEVIRRERSSHAAYFELSRAYAAKENYELAIKNIRKALQYEPGNQWYLNHKAFVLEKDNQYLKAADTYAELILLEPKREENYFRQALMYLQSNKSNEAINCLKQLELIHGIREESSRRIFDIYDKEGNVTKAAETLQSLSEAFPSNTRFKNNLAGYLYENGRKDEALLIYKQVLEIDPANVTANLNIARETALDDKAPALKHLESLLESDNIGLDELLKELIPFISNMSREGQQTDQLLRLSERLLDKFPREAKSCALRADVLFYAGRFEESEQMYEKAVLLDDSNYTLWDQWILNLWELEAYRKMESKALEAVDLFPNKVNAYLLYTVALYLNDQIADASDYLNETRLIAGRNENFTDAIKLINLWMDSEAATSEELNSGIESIDENNLYNAMLLEFAGDIYYKLSDPARTRYFWKKAIAFGANETRINQKIATLN